MSLDCYHSLADSTYQLGAYVPVDHTRDHDRRQSNAVRDLAQRRPSVAEGRRDGVAARIRVDDDTDDQVEGRISDLQGIQRLRKVLSMQDKVRLCLTSEKRVIPTLGSFISAMNVKNPTCPGVDVSYHMLSHTERLYEPA